MAKIPYYFETPIPTYFRENGWFSNENTLKFVIWAFSRCSTEPRTLVIQGKEITLAPFEFIAGRLSSPKECFLTEKQWRGQLFTLLQAGILKKTANSKANQYSCYMFNVEMFKDKDEHGWGQRKGQRRANEGPTKGHDLEDKIIRLKEDHPSIPSNPMTDDFSFENKKIEVCQGVFLTQQEVDVCVKIKGTFDQVKSSIEFIQNSKKRKHPIVDWPNALSKWKIEDRTKNNIQDQIAYAEKLCHEFLEHKNGRGWRCYMHNDKKKDQRGILFEFETAYEEAHFVAFANGDFQNECDLFIKTKNMRQK